MKIDVITLKINQRKANPNSIANGNKTKEIAVFKFSLCMIWGSIYCWSDNLIFNFALLLQNINR